MLLINPPYYNASNRRKYEFPLRDTTRNLEIMLIQHLLSSNDIKTDILDCPYESIVRLSTDVKNIQNNSVIGIFIHNHSNILDIVKFTRSYKSMNRKGKIILAGEFFSIDAERYMNLISEADVGIIGPSENIWLQIVPLLSYEKDISSVKRIIYRRGNELKRNTLDASLFDLDKLPSQKIISARNEPTSVLVSRGCWGNCSFCALHIYYMSCKVAFQKRSPEDVWKDIDQIHCDGEKRIIFQDDNFLGFKEKEGDTWLKSFIECARMRNYEIKFHIYARADDIVKYSYILDDLRSVGLDEIFIGIESFSKRQLRIYSKRITVEENIKAYKILYGKGIPFEIGLIIFEPTVTIEEVLYNYMILKQMRYFDVKNFGNRCVSLSCDLSLIKNSPIEKYYQEQGLLAKNSKGYKFKFELTKKLYDIKEKWCKALSEVQSMDNLINYAFRSLKKDDYIILGHKKSELLRLDIDFIIEICNSLIVGNNGCHDILNRYIILLKDIETVFQKYKEMYNFESE